MWNIGGFVEIERLGERVGEFMRLPFNLPFTGAGQPLMADIIAAARAYARDFLGLLQDTAPAHRADYGAIGEVIVTVATFSF